MVGTLQNLGMYESDNDGLICWFRLARFLQLGFCLVVGLGVMVNVSFKILFCERGWIM